VEGRADQGRTRVGFRPPLTSVLPLAGVLVLLGLVFPTEGSWAFAIVFVFVYMIVRLRQLMVLADDHLEITVIRTRRIPWAQIEGFEPGSRWRGGTQVQTTSGVVWSVSPCSWWGGPAEAADLEGRRREPRPRARR
jgi:hypothetical protein